MANLKVNTDIAVTTAKQISELNHQIYEGFSQVESSINSLRNSWDGSASDNAIGHFNVLRKDYPDNRFNVVDNYVNFILQQVGEGYTQTEDANVSLADAFK